MKKIELLSPAKNLETGIAAINCGADAVYIGAPRFGARAMAANDLTDITKLIRYADKFKARVYITLNTILFDEELPEALKLIEELYQAGAHALIIQDLGLIEAGLPPIPLHASTQMDNRCPEKVLFLEKIGFRRAILARELSLSQINNIRQKTNLELEAFIHGALCVGQSGHCYLSLANGKRSSNRGECAQPCRLKYSLEDSRGKKIISDRHLLSLKDLNLSARLGEMIRAGVTSFKIEGRLKDIYYVKNITAWYRKKIDVLLENDLTLKKSSSGKTTFTFLPDPEITFNRGYTEYCLKNPLREISSIHTPKPIGKYLGKINQVQEKYFTLKSKFKINNGDGLCYFDREKNLQGFKVNKVTDGKIFPYEGKIPEADTEIYRNYDHEFHKILDQENHSRKIEINLSLSDPEGRLCLTAGINEEKTEVQYWENFEKTEAKNKDQAVLTLKNQLAKSGNSIFTVKKINLNLSRIYFIPVGKINEIRRKTLDLLEKKIGEENRPENIANILNNLPYPETQLDYKANIGNEAAEKFYRRHGTEVREWALEAASEFKGKELMITKLCLKQTQGLCPKTNPMSQYLDPLFLVRDQKKYPLEFDCEKCEMKLRSQA